MGDMVDRGQVPALTAIRRIFPLGAAAPAVMCLLTLTISADAAFGATPSWMNVGGAKLQAWRRTLCPLAGDVVPQRDRQRVARIDGDEMGRAQNLMAEGRLDEVSAILCRELALRERDLTVVHPRTIAVFNAFGVYLRKRGEVAQARRLLEELDGIAAGYPREGHSLRRAILQNLGTALYSQGYLQESRAALERALAIAAADGTETNVDIGTALTNLAFALEAQGRDVEAETFRRRVLDIRTHEPGVSLIERAASLNDLGANLTAQRRFPEAQKILEESLLARETLLDPDNLNIGYSLTALAVNAIAQGRSQVAVDYARRAEVLRLRLLGPDHPETALAYQLLARAELSNGDYAQALVSARSALRSRVPMTAREAIAVSDDARTAMRRETSSAAFLLVRSAWFLSVGGPKAWARASIPPLVAEAFVASQRIPASSTADAFERAQARAVSGEKGLSQLARAYEVAEDSRAAADRAIAEAVARDVPTAGAIATRASSEKRIAALRTELVARFPAFFNFARPEPVEISKLLATPDALGQDDALIVMTPGSDDDHGLVWAVTREGCAWSEITLGPAALSDAVLALRDELDLASGYNSREQSARSVDFDRSNARTLYTALFGSPQIAAAVAGKRHWILVPQGVLVGLPFATLVMGDGGLAGATVAARLRNTRWLGLERTLSVLPAVANLASRARMKGARGVASFFGVGDPSFTGSRNGRPGPVTEYAAERGGRASRIQDLPALPGTKQEIEALAGLLGASRHDYLLGDEASERELRRSERAAQLSRATFVAFATHGLVSGDLRNSLAEPALALTPSVVEGGADDGLLTSSEVAEMTINADLVLLSACRTAAANSVGGEGLTGLARAFFAAGAHGLLVSHWRVRDDVASRLTVRTVELMRRSPPLLPAEALRMAMAEVAADPASDGTAISLAHPAVWGAFMMVGAD